MLFGREGSTLLLYASVTVIVKKIQMLEPPVCSCAFSEELSDQAVIVYAQKLQQSSQVNLVSK